jgi:hypothetical protein
MAQSDPSMSSFLAALHTPRLFTPLIHMSVIAPDEKDPLNGF